MGIDYYLCANCDNIFCDTNEYMTCPLDVKHKICWNCIEHFKSMRSKVLQKLAQKYNVDLAKMWNDLDFGWGYDKDQLFGRLAYAICGNVDTDEDKIEEDVMHAIDRFREICGACSREKRKTESMNQVNVFLNELVNTESKMDRVEITNKIKIILNIHKI